MSVIKKVQSEIEAHLDRLFPKKVKVMSRLRGNITNNITAEISKGAMVIMVFPPMIAGGKTKYYKRSCG